MNPTTIYKALNPADAQLVYSRLEAAGFHPFVANEAAVLGMKGYAPAIGGIRVQMPQTEAAEAGECSNSPAA